MPIWKRNVIIYWIGSFITACGLSLVVPFIAFYIEQLGVKDINNVGELSGGAFAVTYLVAATMSTIWGNLQIGEEGKVFYLSQALD